MIENSYENRLKYYQRDRALLWNKNEIINAPYARVNLCDLLSDDTIVTSVLDSLIKYGIAFIEKVPPNLHSTEMAITRMFPTMKTFFGETFEFAAHLNNANHQDLAYSTEYLPPHHDTTYFTESAGLQVLHCIKYDGEKGENMTVDGFKVVEILKETHPDSFERFCSKWVIPAEYIEEGRNHRAMDRVIKLNPLTQKVEQVRFNMNDMACIDTVPPEELQTFYTDMHRLAEICLSSEMEWMFKLKPGTVWIFDNFRVMHARNAFTGKRTMAGCYVARSEFLSACRVAGVL